MPPESHTLSQFWDFAKDIPGMPVGQRIFDDAPSSHPSWKAVMGGSTLGMLNAAHFRQNHQETPLNTQNEALVAMRAAQHDFPMFWVDRSFLECLLRSDPPADLTLSDIRWPFPSLSFILPKNTLVHETDGDCSWITIGKIGGTHACPITGHKLEVRNATVVAITAPWHEKEPPTFNFGIPDEPDFKPFQPLPDFGPGNYTDFSNENPDSEPGKLTAGDTDLGKTAVQLGLRLLLALTARPEYLGSETASRTLKNKKNGGLPREFATPRWIGKDFSIPVDPSAGDVSGGSVRLHWRRGHFKNQPHGTERSLRKIIWIQPYLAGKPV